jgi:hypothetical protein
MTEELEAYFKGKNSQGKSTVQIVMNRISCIGFCFMNLDLYMVGSGTWYVRNISGSGVIKLDPGTIILAYLTVKNYAF